MRKLVFPTVSRYPSDSAPSPWPPFLWPACGWRQRWACRSRIRFKAELAVMAVYCSLLDKYLRIGFYLDFKP